MPRSRPAPLSLDAVHRLGTVVAVWAHPDDETYLAGGVMAALADAGGRVVSVSATLGEGGIPALPPDAARRQRAAELQAALARLGVRESHVLGYADGGCADADADAAADAIAAVLADVRPDTVLTFGPDGITGHVDHRTVSAWTAAAVVRGAPSARLLHATMTPEQVADGADVDRRFGVMVDGEPPQTPADRLAVHVVLAGPALARKVAALGEHRSQTSALSEALGPERYAEWVATEAFVAARAG